LFNSQHAVQNSSTVLYIVVLQGTTATGHFLQNNVNILFMMHTL